MKFNPNKYEVNLNLKIIDVLNIFEKNRVNICAVTNKKKEFVGIITLSDIKKAFLKGASLEQNIINFVNKNPLIIKGEVNENNISDILSSSKFNNIDPPLIPIINLQKKLVNILDKNELFNYSQNFLKKDVSKSKKVLVFGGAGYIGCVLVKMLINLNFEVTVYDKFIYTSKKSFTKHFKSSKLKIVKGDSQNISKIFEAIRKNDIVIHLAEMVGDPLCEKKPKKTYAINYLASMTISNICKNLGISKFIYVSSCSVYGSNDYLTSETSKINPLSIYAKLKALSEKAIIRNFDKHCKPCILRLGTVYGSSFRPRYDLVINLFSGLSANKKQITIAGGNQWRPFVHVKDVSRAIIKILNSDFKKTDNQIFNIVGENVQIKDLGKALKKINPKANVTFSNNVKDNRNYKSSNKKAKKLLNFKTKYTINDGIKEVIEYTKKNKIKNIFNKKYINILNHLKF